MKWVTENANMRCVHSGKVSLSPSQTWVKVEGLEALEASVCWVEDFSAGIEFARPIHSAVFEMLVSRLR